MAAILLILMQHVCQVKDNLMLHSLFAAITTPIFRLINANPVSDQIDLKTIPQKGGIYPYGH